MEGQKFEIPEYPSQTLPVRSPMGPILYTFFFLTFQFRGKSISRGDLGKHLLENLY